MKVKHNKVSGYVCNIWIIVGSDRRPETKQAIEGKIVRFQLGRVRVRIRNRVRIRDNWSPIWTRSPIWSYQFWHLLNSDRRSEPNTVCNITNRLPLLKQRLCLQRRHRRDVDITQSLWSHSWTVSTEHIHKYIVLMATYRWTLVSLLPP